MNSETLYSSLATTYLTLPEGDHIVQITKDQLEDQQQVGDFLYASVIDEKPFGAYETFKRLSLRFQKLTLILDVVNDFKSNKQFVNSFQIVS